MYGIKITNPSGHLLISSEYESLHYFGQASYEGFFDISGGAPKTPVEYILYNTYNGSNQYYNYSGDAALELNRFPRYGWRFIDRATSYNYREKELFPGIYVLHDRHLSYENPSSYNNLRGRQIRIFSIATSHPVVAFIKPSSVNESYGILNQYYDSVKKKTYFYVISTGLTSDPPKLLCFCYPSAFTGNPVGSYGLRTILPNGKTAFDSRRLPLSIHAAMSVIPPAAPCNDGVPGHTSSHYWNDNILDFDFNTDRAYNSYTFASSVPASDLMFSAPSVAQAVYSRRKHGNKKSVGWTGSQEHWSTATWWAMYHQAYKVGMGVAQAGWCMYHAGYWMTSWWESGGLGGGGGGSWSTGNQPYADKTINRTANTIIIADSSYYL